MPGLLEDLAEETSASNRRTAAILDAEAQELEKMRQLLAAALEERRQKIVETARQATEHVISRMPQVEGVWRSAVADLRKNPTKESAEGLLRRLLDMFESGQQLVHSPRMMWKLAEQLGVAPERFDELDRAEKRFKELAKEARLALDHRTQDWQPSEPDRLALGLQLAREGKTVKAEEAQARFRRTKG